MTYHKPMTGSVPLCPLMFSWINMEQIGYISSCKRQFIRFILIRSVYAYPFGNRPAKIWYYIHFLKFISLRVNTQLPFGYRTL